MNENNIFVKLSSRNLNLNGCYSIISHFEFLNKKIVFLRRPYIDNDAHNQAIDKYPSFPYYKDSYRRIIG
jgi:hypothetical protein